MSRPLKLFLWLLVSLLRQYGLAARFVSGYLVQLAPDAYVTEADGGPAGPAADIQVETRDPYGLPRLGE